MARVNQLLAMVFLSSGKYLKGAIMAEKSALLIIDMVKDYFKDDNNYPTQKRISCYLFHRCF